MGGDWGAENMEDLNPSISRKEGGDKGANHGDPNIKEDFLSNQKDLNMAGNREKDGGGFGKKLNESVGGIHVHGVGFLELILRGVLRWKKHMLTGPSRWTPTSQELSVRVLLLLTWRKK